MTHVANTRECHGKDPRGGERAPGQGQVSLAYRRAMVRGNGPWPQPATVLGWWTRPDGVTMCRLRMSGSARALWVVFDPERIELLVSGGT